MADQEFKSYDTQDTMHFHGFRLAKDAEVRETANGKMVRLTTVSTSRNEGKNGIKPTWWELNVNDFQADLAGFLKKGDVVLHAEGHPYMRTWGEADDKVSMCCDKVQLKIAPDFFKTLKERGFVPGKRGEAAPTKSKRPAKKESVELPED